MICTKPKPRGSTQAVLGVIAAMICAWIAVIYAGWRKAQTPVATAKILNARSIQMIGMEEMIRSTGFELVRADQPADITVVISYADDKNARDAVCIELRETQVKPHHGVTYTNIGSMSDPKYWETMHERIASLREAFVEQRNLVLNGAYYTPAFQEFPAS